MDPELEHALDHEFREEMAAWERAAAAIRPPLRERLGELAVSDREVIVSLAHGSMGGCVVHVGADFLSVAGDTEWDVRFQAVVGLRLGQVVSRPAPWTEAPSFEARLRELRVTQPLVVFRLVDGSSIRARLAASAADHAELDDDGPLIVPFAAIAAVARPVKEG